MLLTSTRADEDTIVPALIVWVDVLSIPITMVILSVANTISRSFFSVSWANSTAVQVCLTAANTISLSFISVTVTDSFGSRRRHSLWMMSGPFHTSPSQTPPKSFRIHFPIFFRSAAVRLRVITRYKGAGDRPSTAVELVERYAHHLSSKTVSRSIRDLLFGWRASLLRGQFTMAGLSFHPE